MIQSSMNVSTVDIIVSSADVNSAIAQSDAPWVMLCDSKTTLVDGAVENC